MRRLLELRSGEAVLLAGASLLFVLVLADVVSGGFVAHLDGRVVEAVAASGGGPQWAQVFAGLGSPGVSGGVVAIAALACAHRSWRLWPLALTAVNLAATGVVVPVVKAAVGRDGPPTAVSSSSFAGYFPSGHTASAVVCFGTATFLAVALLRPELGELRTVASQFRWDKTGRVAVGVGLTLGGVVGLGTVVTGNHWPSDVAGGLLVGVVVLVTGLALVRTYVSRRSDVRR